MITFTGYKLSNLQKDIIAEAIGSALDVLVSKRMKKTLSFDINIEKDLYKQQNIWGDMDIEDDEEQSPKSYTIRLNYSGVESFAKMLEVSWNFPGDHLALTATGSKDSTFIPAKFTKIC